MVLPVEVADEVVVEAAAEAVAEAEAATEVVEAEAVAEANLPLFLVRTRELRASLTALPRPASCPVRVRVRPDDLVFSFILVRGLLRAGLMAVVCWSLRGLVVTLSQCHSRAVELTNRCPQSAHT